jgi:histidinol phosphatase-like enzyme
MNNLDLNKMIDLYLAAAETMGEHIRNAQRGIGAANLIGQQIIAHQDFQKMPAEMQEKFRSSQVSVEEILKTFEGFSQ